ncbi:MAG: hypothetical protein LBT71_03455 [Azoarcus sp.]|nr:hypothetical protein [Azoarcus sp.]
MFPILPFVAGIAVGASVVGLARKAKTGAGVHEAVEKAERKIRQTAVSGLEVIRQSSEQWRDRLAASKAKTDAVDASTAEPEQAAVAGEESAPHKPRGKKAAE